MKRNLYILLYIIFFSTINCYGQKKIFLEHKKNPKKKKNIKLEREYTIKTIDTIYYSKIVGFNDTSLSVLIWSKTNRDTVYHYKQYGNTKDTSVIRPIYKKDTTMILFSNILYLKKDWFKNKRWLEPFGWVAVGSVLGVGLLPVAAIDKGSEGIKEWAEFEAILLGISVPIIFIGTRQTKYDIKKKWNIKVDK